MFLRICAIGFSGFLAYDLVRFPLIPRLAQSLGAGPQAIGFAVAASTMTGIVGKWLTGGLSDHWGRRRLLLIGCALSAAMPLAYLQVHDYRTLILLRFLHGAVTAILGPVARAVVADLAGAQERGAKLGTFASSVQVGMSAGRWLGGLLLFWGGFRYPLIAASLAGGLALWLVVGWPQQASPPSVAPGAWAEVFRSVVSEAQAMVRSRLLMATAMVEACQMLMRGAIEAFLPIYAVEVAGLNDSHVGMLFGLQLLTLVVAKPLTGWWSDRIGRVPLIGGGLIVCSALVWLIPHTTALLGLSLLLIGYSLGASAVSASALALTTDVGSASQRGAATARYGASHGVFGTLVDMGHASGPLLGGALIARWHYQGAFLFLAGLMIMVAIAFVANTRAARQP